MKSPNKMWGWVLQDVKRSHIVHWTPYDDRFQFFMSQILPTAGLRTQKIKRS